MIRVFSKKKSASTSVVRRMYIGFAVMVSLFIVTVVLMLNGTSRVHQQLLLVNSDALPLVTYSNLTSVNLLIADKTFKDFLTSEDSERQQLFANKFEQNHQDFIAALDKLKHATQQGSALAQQLSALLALEQRYFAESKLAMNNYRNQLAAQQERRITARRFQKLQTELRLGMSEFVNSQQDLAVKLMAKSYFEKLKQTETTTSDALASDDIKTIAKAMKDNKRSVTQLNFSYQGLVTQLPELKQHFDQATTQFIQDVGKKGGVLDQHYRSVQSRNMLYQNIAVLAEEVDIALAILGEFRHEAEVLKDSAIDSAEHIYQDSYQHALLIGGAVSAFLLFLAWLLAQNVRKPLQRMLTTLEALTDGDMRQRVDDNKFIEFEQLGSHINTLASHLQSILQKLGLTSTNLAEVSAQNQLAMSDSTTRLGEQRQQTASVATAMTEMEHSVKDVETSARSSMAKVGDVETAVHTGSLVMSNNTTTINLLSGQLNESVEAVSAVKQMSVDIGSILDVIQQIAMQTNLLALNAAIEAARAGEQGRGFSVVADEVRVLAKRTTDATSEIEDMIQNLQTKSEDANEVIQRCVAEMKNSVEHSAQANKAMTDIQTSIAEISQMSYQIAHAAEEQTTTANMIARSLEDINHVADSNSHSMNLVAKVSNKLDELAHQQNELVLGFKV
ncbi:MULTISPECIES: methyl-accepting chemotaxis protein [unclassified Agarivorans]|uniref:methyl-accepting chemotaxis protein n=1 Tax=unclassified Agarivorans TaxID=2636026 RepID=UPI0026E37002|nr:MULTISPECIES: methyl-accepting chemotaxis protein [unclassified Agarivorans]MDO6684638.1 methyl-accepting chemotaxis protein [Agarivorans sp. 3_MG-2023]MDO6714803.1 methyl-accepting chemotaxis protein [Agarivorans sp. 2_MG-2023]